MDEGIIDFIFTTKYLPDCFTNIDVLSNIEEIFARLGSLENMLANNFDKNSQQKLFFDTVANEKYRFPKGVEPISYTMSKHDGGTRIMSVSNPIVLLILHRYILEHQDKILREQTDETENYISNSHMFYNEKTITFKNSYENLTESGIIVEDEELIERCIETSNFFDASKEKLLKSNGSYYCLKMDIANFFNNIYSHMITWNLKYPEEKEIFDNLDIINRTLNSNETKGIITGTYTSNLFSEIILSKVDRELIEECRKKDISFVRYCDDYYFYSDSKEKLNEIIVCVEKNLALYKLDINTSKTKIVEFPFYTSVLDTKQKTKALLERLNKKVEKDKEEDEIEKVEDLISNLEEAMKREYTNCNYILKALYNSYDCIFDDSVNAEIFLDYLINLMFKYDYMSNSIARLILKILSNNSLDKDRIITKWIKKSKNIVKRLKDISIIFLAYIILESNITNQDIDEFFLSLFKENDLAVILSIEYFINKSDLNICKEELKNYIEEMEILLKESYGGGRYLQAYYSKYWLFLYINFTRWKIHEKKGLKTILKKYNFINGSYSSKQLKILQVMHDLKIDLFKI